MYAVFRIYSGAGAADLFHLLEKRKSEVEAVISRVPGLVSYTMIRSEEGGASITVCEDREGCQASIKAARDWISEHASGLGVSAPEVIEGETLVHLG